MSKLQAVYYRDLSGGEPVKGYLRGLGPRRWAVIRAQVERLNDLTSNVPHLPFPYSSQIAGELRELRLHAGREHYRVLYRRSQNLIVLLHAFRKTTPQVPGAEIEVAVARWDDFKARMDARPRNPPRAAGHDAP